MSSTMHEPVIPVHAAFPADSVVRQWLAGAGGSLTNDESRAGVIVFSPATAGAEAVAARAGRAGACTIACLPVLREDGWHVAEGAETFGNIRADAYASDEATLRAALRFATAEERGMREQGPFRMTWLGPLGELFLAEPPIGRSFPVGTAGIGLGRAPDNEIVLRQGAHSDQSSVARRHAVFEPAGRGVRVRDLGSTNGTFLARSRISEALLRPGDEVAVCGTMRLRLDGTA